MTLRQKLLYMDLTFTYFAVLQMIVNASDGPHLSFTCEPRGIKHHTNDSETLGRTPNVDMTCPTKLSVKTDAHTEISCQVLSKTFAKITWFHNGHPISNQRKSHVTVDRKSCDQTLKIKFAKTSDGGHYTCQVANSNGTINKTCVLDVQVRTTKKVQVGFLKMAGNRQKAILQGSVVLKCNMLHAQDGWWLRNSNRMTHNDRHVHRRERMFGKTVMMLYLKITNVTKNDEGLYMCVGYRNGIQANKTFHLKTEPCPIGHICPHEGNTAIRIPSAVWPGVNNSNTEEINNCSSRGSNGVFVAGIKSTGSCSSFQGYMLTFVYIPMALYGCLVCTC